MQKYVTRVAAGNCQRDKWMIGNWRQCQWLDCNGLVKRLYSLALSRKTRLKCTAMANSAVLCSMNMNLLCGWL